MNLFCKLIEKLVLQYFGNAMENLHHVYIVQDIQERIKCDIEISLSYGLSSRSLIDEVG